MVIKRRFEDLKARDQIGYKAYLDNIEGLTAVSQGRRQTKATLHFFLTNVLLQISRYLEPEFLKFPKKYLNRLVLYRRILLYQLIF